MPRRTHAVLGVSLLAALLADAVTGAAASAAPHAVSTGGAKAELKAALAAAKQKGSVRITVHFVSGKVTGEVVQDSAQHSAKQTVAIGKERVSFLLANGEAYVSGNVAGLTSYLGFPKATATALLGQWVAVSPADVEFADISAGLTLSAALKEVTPGGTLARGKNSKVNGQTAASISGTGDSSNPRRTLFVATKGSHLPVESVASGGSGTKTSGEIVAFSRWGEVVHVTIPPQAVAMSTLTAG